MFVTTGRVSVYTHTHTQRHSLTTQQHKKKQTKTQKQKKTKNKTTKRQEKKKTKTHKTQKNKHTHTHTTQNTLSTLTLKHTLSHTHTQTHTHTLTHSHTLSHSHTHSLTNHTHSHSHSHTHSLSLTLTHTHTHTHHHILFNTVTYQNTFTGRIMISGAIDSDASWVELLVLCISSCFCLCLQLLWKTSTSWKHCLITPASSTRLIRWEEITLSPRHSIDSDAVVCVLVRVESVASVPERRLVPVFHS